MQRAVDRHAHAADVVQMQVAEPLPHVAQEGKSNAEVPSQDNMENYERTIEPPPEGTATATQDESQKSPEDYERKIDQETDAIMNASQNNESAPAPEQTPEDQTETLEERLKRIEAMYRTMISDDRESGHNVAADNLERFLEGKGGVKKLDVTWLRSFSAVTNAEHVNHKRFEKQLHEKATSLKSGESATLSDYWDRTLTGRGELYYASGTSTIRSRGAFKLKRSGDQVTITGTVDQHWFDPYDWHAGLAAYVPGYGLVGDSDALLMETHRGAKPFQMEADWQQRLSAQIIIDNFLLFDSTDFKWSGP